MGVPPESVYPSDNLEYICQFGFDNMAFVEIVPYIEKALHVRIPSRFWKLVFPTKLPASKVSLGDLVRRITENWTSLPGAGVPKPKARSR